MVAALHSADFCTVMSSQCVHFPRDSEADQSGSGLALEGPGSVLPHLATVCLAARHWMLFGVILLLAPACSERPLQAEAVKILVASGGEWVPYLHSEVPQILRYTKGFTGHTVPPVAADAQALMADLRLLYYRSGVLLQTVDFYTKPLDGKAFAVRRMGTKTEWLRIRPEATAFHQQAQNEIETPSFQTNHIHALGH